MRRAEGRHAGYRLLRVSDAHGRDAHTRPRCGTAPRADTAPVLEIAMTRPGRAAITTIAATDRPTRTPRGDEHRRNRFATKAAAVIVEPWRVISSSAANGSSTAVSSDASPDARRSTRASSCRRRARADRLLEPLQPTSASISAACASASRGHAGKRQRQPAFLSEFATASGSDPGHEAEIRHRFAGRACAEVANRPCRRSAGQPAMMSNSVDLPHPTARAG